MPTGFFIKSLFLAAFCKNSARLRILLIFKPILPFVTGRARPTVLP